MIILDTAAWLWHVSEPGRLSSAARSAVDEAAAVGVSAISVWEVGMLVAKQRIALDPPLERWVAAALSLPRVELVGLDPAIAIRATQLPGELHGDPADRIIVATTWELGAALVTPDRRLRAYPHVATVW